MGMHSASFLAAAMLVTACGGGDTDPTDGGVADPDASPAADATPPACAIGGTITVIATGTDGNAVADVDVVTHCPGGEVLSVDRTDGDGRVVLDHAPGGQVTVAFASHCSASRLPRWSPGPPSIPVRCCASSSLRHDR